MTLIKSTPFRWLAFIISAAFIYSILADIYDLAPRCHDGFRSSAIGTQGACSWHGGIDWTRNNWAVRLSIIFGFVLGFGPKWFFDAFTRPKSEPCVNPNKPSSAEIGPLSDAEAEPMIHTDEELRKIIEENELRAALSQKYLDDQLSRVKNYPAPKKASNRNRKKRR